MWGMTLIHFENNRRKNERTRSLKGGRIILNNRNSAMDCMVRNLSAGGAKLVLTVPLSLPDDFELRFEDGKEHACAVRWRNAKEFGVEFLNRA